MDQTQASAPAEAQPVTAQATETPVNEAPQKQYVDPEALEKFIKVKVDGQEIEMPLKEAVRIQSLESASWKRLHEATKKSKELERKAKEFEDDPDWEHMATLEPRMWIEHNWQKVQDKT
jgi:hypothetical protein